MSLPEGALTLSGHSDRVDRVLPLPEHKLIVTASLDKKLRVFSSETGECEKVLEGHGAGVVGLAHLGDGFIASGDSRPVGAELRIWNVLTGVCVTTLSPRGCVWAISVLSPSRFVTAARGDLVFYSHASGTEVTETHRIEKAHADVIFDIASCKDKIVSASRDAAATVQVWSVSTYEKLGTLKKHKKAVRTVAMNESRIVTGCLDGKIRLFDAETLECKRIIKGTHTNLIYSVRFLGTGMVLSSSWDGTVCVSHPESGGILAKVKLPFQVWTAAHFAEKKFVAGGAFFDAVLFKVDSLSEKEVLAEEALRSVENEIAENEVDEVETTGLPAAQLALTIRTTLKDIIARIINRATLAIDNLSSDTLWPVQRIRRRFDM